ncbi:hypothetical protein K493DRAFT_305500 [Basidiobolus meristosporus CBS 931.73]|uniref:Uncharacterized protein n=1 Tax=Basidiobolus meristosporus CBS 931.73 TaxID=1314790 RepID=A0A1Y1XVF8_9FUNG|nr:hypothetical protein K493DRAFT_305500 [Basidiobolus meristosporus CBS 931.73]|eukprot:ORX89757.1 hypothetical protein K493DRAFT_305500 [Basidiobolus meristosporus CBS 931.73]
MDLSDYENILNFDIIGRDNFYQSRYLECWSLRQMMSGAIWYPLDKSPYWEFGRIYNHQIHLELITTSTNVMENTRIHCAEFNYENNQLLRRCISAMLSGGKILGACEMLQLTTVPVKMAIQLPLEKCIQLPLFQLLHVDDMEPSAPFPIISLYSKPKNGLPAGLVVQELGLVLLCSACFLDRSIESTQDERKIHHLYIQHRFGLFIAPDNVPELEKILRFVLETPNQWLNVLDICKSFTLIQATELVSVIVKEKLILNEFVKGLLVHESYLPEFYKERISKSILTICQAIPHRALAIRYLLTTAEQLPDLALRITLDYCNDEISYLNAIFNGSTTWVIHSLNKMQDVLLGLQKKLFSHLESVTLSNGRTSQIDMCLILRVICAFGGLLAVKIPEQDVFKCLVLIKNAKTQR